MPLDVAVALTATAAPDALVESGQLAPELYARFEDGAAKPIELAGLRERSEDLVLDRRRSPRARGPARARKAARHRRGGIRAARRVPVRG